MDKFTGEKGQTLRERNALAKQCESRSDCDQTEQSDKAHSLTQKIQHEILSLTELSKNATVWLHNAVLCLKAANEMISRVEHNQTRLEEQSDLGIHCCS